jgi:type II secretory pathway pseudopilin PulG
MWPILVVAIMVTLASFYRTVDKEGIATAEQARADQIAESMAVYRNAVRLYFTQHPNEFESIDINKLRAADALPSWSTLYQKPATSIWANYRDTDGVIYIYASSPPPANITADIARLSQNSLYAGVFRTGDTTLFSPVYGNTGIKLPPQSKAAIPNGSPVWIAMRE